MPHDKPSKEDWQLGVGAGWAEIVGNLVDLCEKHGVEILQVKEKFGGLRFYVGSAPDLVHDAIEEAEDQSVRVCEVCGEPGQTINRQGWLMTRCEAHNAT